MRNWLTTRVVLVGGLLLGGLLYAAEGSKGEKEPTPAARQLTQKVKAAYAQLQSVQVAGKIAADLNVGGRESARSVDIAATYKAPALFRHEVKGEVIAGSTGKKLYVLDVAGNVYKTIDAPEGKVSYRMMPRPFGEMLEVQDPALLLALSTGSIDDVLEGATFVKVGEDTVIGGDALPTLTFTASDGRNVNLAFDAKTSLLRQARYDMSDLLRKRGAEKVVKALITISYDQVNPNGATEAAQFAWMPPATAQQANDGADEGEAALALQGQAAPDFTLPGMDGKPVTLASLKGHVILLDFWATWCGPCVMSLPELDALYQARKDSGVQVFAVNAGEEKDVVAAFLKAKKLTLPVLLDTDQAVIEKFSIGAFPTTIIIGPNGIVSKVFVGMPRGGKEELEQALDRAK